MTLDSIPDAWKRTILLPLVKLMFDAANQDLNAAWTQAVEVIRGFVPKTEAEFRGAVQVAILNVQANECFAEASEPGTTTSQAISLRGKGLALVKAAERAEIRLSQLQKIRAQYARQAAEAAQAADCAPEPAPEATPEEAPESAPEKAPQRAANPKTLQQETRELGEYARKHNISYAQAWSDRERARKAAAQTQPTG